MFNLLSDAIRVSRADYTEIRLERSWNTAIAYRGSRLEGAAIGLDLGGFVRCLNRGYGWGMASFNGSDQLLPMVSRAHELSLALPLDTPIRLADIPVRTQEVHGSLDGDVRGVPLDEKRRLLEVLNQGMLATDRRIVDTRASYRDEVVERWFANSEGAWLYELRPEVSFAAVAVAREDSEVERAVESYGVRGGWRSVGEADQLFRSAARRAIALLGAPRVRNGVFPVVLDPRLVGAWVHRMVGHRSEADSGWADPEAPELLRLGAQVASPLLTIGDDGSAAGLRGSLVFDDEGAPTQNTLLIQHGVVVGRLHNRETAARADERPTGNARAISYRHPPLVRLTNTYVANGAGSLEDLIRDVTFGVYCCDAMGGRCHRQDFTMTTAYGHLIRDGRLEELVKPVILSGDLFEALRAVDAVAGDFRWAHLASGCGKAGQAPLPVTQGAPHLRMRAARVGSEGA
jgi:TldD protein